jgi:hypothetical protein
VVVLFKFLQYCEVFSSPDPKGQVSYCHHLVSVIIIIGKHLPVTF